MLRATIEYVILVVVIITIMLLSSCGPYKVDAQIAHTIEIDLVKLETYFRPSCEIEQPNNVQSCVEGKVGDFLQYVMSQ